MRTPQAEAVHVMREVAAEFRGDRRDEERAGAKARVLSFRDEFGQSEPRREGAEVWSVYNGRIRKGEHARVPPISNWTELDVWQCLAEEALEVPSIYFAHEREVFARDGLLDAVSPLVELIDGEQPQGTS
jgi:sulfate adenylyltransferase subunit 2